MKYLIFLIFLLFSSIAICQISQEEINFTKKNFREGGKPQMRLPGRNRPLNDSIEALKFANEIISHSYPYYFEKEKPYRIVSYKKYWIIRGSNIAGAVERLEEQ